MQLRVCTFLMIVTVVCAAPTTTPEELPQTASTRTKAEEEANRPVSKEQPETEKEKQKTSASTKEQNDVTYTEIAPEEVPQSRSAKIKAIEEANPPGPAEESSGIDKEKQKTSDSSEEQKQTGMSCPLNLELKEKPLNLADCQNDFIELTTQKDGKFQKIIETICKCHTTLQIVSKSSGEIIATGEHQFEQRNEAGTVEEKIVVNYADLVKNLSYKQVKEIHEYAEDMKKVMRGEEDDKRTGGFTLIIRQ